MDRASRTRVLDMAGTALYLIIVRHDDPELYRHLLATIAGGAIEVILDRRMSRRWGVPVPDRRRPVCVERDVRRRDYVIVRPHSSG